MAIAGSEGLNLISLGDYVAVAGEVMEAGSQLATIVIKLSGKYVSGASPAYIRGALNDVNSGAGTASSGATEIDYTAALYDQDLTQLASGSLVEFVGYTTGDPDAIYATSANILSNSGGSSLNGQHGSGVRGQHGSGVRGQHGSGVRGQHGSGVRGQHGSGVRGQHGSGVRGQHGSGVRGQHGSGVRGQHGSGVR